MGLWYSRSLLEAGRALFWCGLLPDGLLPADGDEGVVSFEDGFARPRIAKPVWSGDGNQSLANGENDTGDRRAQKVSYVTCFFSDSDFIHGKKTLQARDPTSNIVLSHDFPFSFVPC